MDHTVFPFWVAFWYGRKITLIRFRFSPCRLFFSGLQPLLLARNRVGTPSCFSFHSYRVWWLFLKIRCVNDSVKLACFTRGIDQQIAFSLYISGDSREWCRGGYCFCDMYLFGYISSIISLVPHNFGHFSALNSIQKCLPCHEMTDRVGFACTFRA